MASLAELEADLASVTTAIRRIEQSLTQEHWQGGDRHRAPELTHLYARQARLRRDISELSGGRIVLMIAD